MFAQVLFVYIVNDMPIIKHSASQIKSLIKMKVDVDSSSSAAVANAPQNISDGWSRLPGMNFFTEQENRVDTPQSTTIYSDHQTYFSGH